MNSVAKPTSALPINAQSLHDERRTARWVLVLAVLALIAIWAFVAWSSYASRAQALAGNAQMMERMVNVLEEQTTRQLKTVEMLLTAAERWIETHPARDPRFDTEFVALVEEMSAFAGGTLKLRLVSPEGGLYTVPSSLDRPVAVVDDRNYLREALSGVPGATHFGPAIISRVSGRWVYPVSRSLKQQHRRHGLAVLVVMLELDVLAKNLERMRPEGWVIGLGGRDGTIMLLSPRRDDFIGRRVPWLAERSGDIKPGERDSFETAQTLTGIPHQYSYAGLSEYPVAVGVAAPVHSVLASWKTQVQVAISIAVILSALFMGILLHVLRLLNSLSDARDRLRDMASRDVMTGAYNHTSFVDILDREFARSRRYSQPLAVMMLDVDFFKRINDGYGHAIGDDALCAFARILGDGVRNVDAIGRLGGEEFAIMLPNTELDDARQLAERLRENAAAIVIRTEAGEEVRFTTSVGVAEMALDDIGVEDLLRRADAALYRAKEQGRNRVEVSTGQAAEAV